MFSLAGMRKLSEEGVEFQSPVNGDTVFLTPERSMEVQHDLNADVTMIFDECTPYPATESEARKSMELSLRWAARSRQRFDELKDAEAGPRRGAVRYRSGRNLMTSCAMPHWPVSSNIGFDGYAIGGLAVGEPEAGTQRRTRFPC